MPQRAHRASLGAAEQPGSLPDAALLLGPRPSGGGSNAGILEISPAEAEQPSRGDSGGGAASYTRLTLLVCLLLTSAALSQYVGAQQIAGLIKSVQRAPLGSVLVFTVVFAAAIVLLVPGMLLSVGTGAAYGFPLGCVVAWTGTLLGQVGAFLLGRCLLREWVRSYMQRRAVVPNFADIDARISSEGWKFVLLLRLSPVVPYNILNYVLGLTAIDTLPYALASGAGALPFVLLFVYLGSVSSDVYALLHDGARRHLSPSVLTALACLVILSSILLCLLCKRALLEPASSAQRAAVLDGEAAGLLEMERIEQGGVEQGGAAAE